jgi:hypothetical protein
MSSGPRAGCAGGCAARSKGVVAPGTINGITSGQTRPGTDPGRRTGNPPLLVNS